MTKIFITGGAGFIGSHTVDQALASGHAVTVYDIKPWSDAVNLHHLEGHITYIEGDILNYEHLLASMKSATHVLHLAAIVSVQKTIIEPRQTHEVNVTGTVNVFEAARVTGAERVVYASSAAVYGAKSGSFLTEANDTEPESPYGLHKLICDQYATLYRSLFSQSSMSLRYFNVFGPRQDASSPYSGVISIFVVKTRAGVPLTIYGDGSASRDYVSVHDVARVNLLALQSTEQGCLNIGSGKETTVLGLIDALETVAGTPIVRVHEESRKGDIHKSSTSIAAAKAKLLFEPTVSLEAGLTELLA